MIRDSDAKNVILTVHRENADEPLTITVPITDVELPSVFHEMLDSKIGYIRITEFKGVTEEQYTTAFQDLKDIPENYSVPADRTKPWGTGQAVLAAKDVLHEPFMVINADDYYGKTAFRQLHDWLVLEHEDTAVAMAGFILKNTLSENGGVTRGVCTVKDGHTHIVDVVETSNIIKTPEGAEANGVKLDPESYVSMNMWGFPAKEGCDPAFLAVLEAEFQTFFAQTVPENPLKSEYLLPTLIGGLLRKGKYTVKVLETNDKWFGVTYQEDKADVVENFKRLIADGVYPEELYSDLL